MFIQQWCESAPRTAMLLHGITMREEFCLLKQRSVILKPSVLKGDTFSKPVTNYPLRDPLLLSTHYFLKESMSDLVGKIIMFSQSTRQQIAYCVQSKVQNPKIINVLPQKTKKTGIFSHLKSWNQYICWHFCFKDLSDIFRNVCLCYHSNVCKVNMKQPVSLA